MLKTLQKIIKIFNEAQVEYCLIGGLAMMLHHGRANTVDIDFYILVENLKEIKDLFKSKNIQVKEAGNFQLKARLNSVPIDLLWADHYLGVEVVYRSVEKKLGDLFVRVATPEDLILLKMIANRSIDRRDVEELRELFKGKLDEKYISRKIKKLKEQGVL